MSEEEENLNHKKQKMKHQTSFENDVEGHLTCGICNDLIYMAASITPCLHTFCGGCLSQSHAVSSDCPMCRVFIQQVNKNHTIDSLVSAFILSHPEKAWTTATVFDLTSRNTIKYGKMFSNREEISAAFNGFSSNNRSNDDNYSSSSSSSSSSEDEEGEEDYSNDENSSVDATHENSQQDRLVDIYDLSHSNVSANANLPPPPFNPPSAIAVDESDILTFIEVTGATTAVAKSTIQGALSRHLNPHLDHAISYYFSHN